MRRLTLISLAISGLAACASPGPTGPAGPVAPPPPAEPQAPAPQRVTQTDAETICLAQGAQKYGVGLSYVVVNGSRRVDRGYRVDLRLGGADRICIVSPAGAVISLQ